MKTMKLLSSAAIFVGVMILVWLWLRRMQFVFAKRGTQTQSQTTPRILLPQLSPEEFIKQYVNSASNKNASYAFWEPSFVPISDDMTKAIIRRNFQRFMNMGKYLAENKNLFGNLYNSTEKSWKQLWNKLSPTFKTGKTKMIFDSIRTCTGGLAYMIGRELEKSVAIENITSRYITDVLTVYAFGLNCNDLENLGNEFGINGKGEINSLFENYKLFFFITLPALMRHAKIKGIPKDIDDFFIDIEADRVAYRGKTNTSTDFEIYKNDERIVDQAKVNAENITADEMTMGELSAQALIFFEAGLETSATVLNLALYDLAKNHDTQSEARFEVVNNLVKHEGNLTYESMLDMYHLEQTIYEILAKYPAILSSQKICTKGDKIVGNDPVVEKGTKETTIAISRPTLTIVPSDEVPRICTGNNFGIMQAKLGLAEILLSYEFSVNQRTKEPIEFDPESYGTSAKGGIWLDFKKID